MPANTINIILKGEHELAKSVAEAHKHAREFYMKNRNAIPQREHILEAVELVKEKIGLILTTEQLEEILILFPQARISLAVYEGCRDSEVEDLLIEVVSAFFAGCKAPEYKDDVNPECFFTYLRSQAKEMGYNVR